ncbi:TPA: hypothetical protein IAA92_02495 [Candidatus Galligastranaerophilus intestinigallinarum]|nr:hypothetical protein [Candidatus Galligastranaerophilus intestinigallinarum]
MNLGNKTLNDLISKDNSAAKGAAIKLLAEKDVESFKILNSKSEFLFDFIKEKILKNLIGAVNSKNCLNLFEFLKVYSPDFKGFILHPLVQFKTPEIEDKMLNFLCSGSDEEKTYATEFFIILADKTKYEKIKANLNADFEPLKIASINYLSNLGFRLEFEESLNILEDKSKDNFEKLTQVEFLAYFGDKKAFEPIYNYFINEDNSYTIANFLLDLKPFSTLIEENKEDEILNILSSIILNFPDSITFEEINYYINEGLFEFLLESENNLSALILFYLKNKTELILEDENYSIDLTKENKKEANIINSKLNNAIQIFDKKETLTLWLNSINYFENILSLEIIKEENIEIIEPIYNLLEKTTNNEIIMDILYCLQNQNKLNETLINKILLKTENEILKAQIKSFIS